MLLRADQAIELLSMFVDGAKQTCRGGLTMSVHRCKAEMDQPLASNLDFSARVSRVLMAHPLPASLAATPSRPLKGRWPCSARALLPSEARPIRQFKILLPPLVLHRLSPQP